MIAMKKTRTYLPILATCVMLAFVSCNRLDIPGMFVNRSDTEERVADWLDWNSQHDPIVIDMPSDYCFFSCSDSHYSERDSIVPQGENDRLYRYITAMRNEPDAAFAIHAGDLVNERGEAGFRMAEASLRYCAETQAEDKPCFPVIGNHDVYFDCAPYFKQYFHTSTYTVTVNADGQKDLFLFLDSGNGTHGKRQMDWLEEQLSHRKDYRHCFVISHNWLFRTTYNYTTTPAANLPEDEQYAFMDLMSRNEVDMVIMGHFHHREVQTVNHVPYVMTDNLNDKAEATYLVVRCSDDKVGYEYRALEPENQD